MVRGRQAGVVRDFQSTPTVQQKLGTVGGADSSRTSCTQKKKSPQQRRTHVPGVERYMCVGWGWSREVGVEMMKKKTKRKRKKRKKKTKRNVTSLPTAPHRRLITHADCSSELLEYN